MDYSTERWIDRFSQTLRTQWSAHRSRILQAAIGLMTIAAAVWLSYEFWRLIWQEGYWGAIDLRVLHSEVLRWASGGVLYSEARGALYPPATFVLLWPFVGWLEFMPVRLLWTVITIGALVWLVYLTVAACHANARLERIFVALVPLSLYATGATIGNGQLGVLILPMLVCGILLLDRYKRKVWTDVLAAGLILWTLAKPSISIPFFWIVIFAPRRLRPALFVVLGYVALTLIAALYQDSSAVALFRDWLIFAPQVIGQAGYMDLFNGLRMLGLAQYYLPIASAVLVLTGLWVYLYRDTDVWILMAVVAVVARYWTYHGWYDDLLLLLPMIALYRIAKSGVASDSSDVVAGILFAASLIVSIAPGGLYLFPAPFNAIYVAMQMAIWLAVFVFLLVYAGRTRKVGQIEMARA